MIMNFIFIIRNSLYRSKVPLQTWHCNVDILYKISNEVGDRTCFLLVSMFSFFLCMCLSNAGYICRFKRIHVVLIFFFAIPDSVDICCKQFEFSVSRCCVAGIIWEEYACLL